jgi:hypothetical protein
MLLTLEYILWETWRHLGRQVSHLSVQTELDGFYVSQTAQLLRLLSMDTYIFHQQYLRH